MSIVTKIVGRSNSWKLFAPGYGLTQQRNFSGGRFFSTGLDPAIPSSSSSGGSKKTSGSKKTMGVLAGGAVAVAAGWKMMDPSSEKAALYDTKLQITPKDRQRLDLELSHISNDPELYKQWNGQSRKTIRMQLARNVWTHVIAGSNETEISLDQFRERVKHLIPQEQGKEDGKGESLGDADQEEALLQVFAIADVNRDGFISFAEFYRALCLILLSDVGDQGALHELLYETIDIDGNGEIDQDELLHFIKRFKAVGGSIPVKDQSMTKGVGILSRPATSEEICQKWLNKFDVNGDRKISREEFHVMADEIDFSKSFIGRDFIVPRKDTLRKTAV